MKSFHKNKSIDSILQITKDVVIQNYNYHDYMINENNAFYRKQLPLLMKHSRINTLVSSKAKIIEIDKIWKNVKNTSSKKENKSQLNISKSILPLDSIRSMKIRSNKISSICPIYDSKGSFIKGSVSQRRIFSYKSLLNSILSDNITKRNKEQVSYKSIKFNNFKKIKNFNKNKGLNCKDIRTIFFNEPEYNNIKYDESQIFGNRKLYENIIKKKLIELQTTYNKNLITKKEKSYKYGIHKKKINLTFDSLKIRMNEVINEKNTKIEVYEKSSLEYSFPLSLLPLFYSKNKELFLMILTKLLIWDEENQNFYIEKNDNEVIANILRNDDSFINENDRILFRDEKEISQNDLNELEIDRKNNGRDKNDLLLNDYKSGPIPLINSIKYIKPKSKNSNSLIERKGSMDKLINVFENKFKTKSYDIYSKKMNMNGDYLNISTFEYFWVTPKKSFILTIETPLITVNIPSNSILVKKYIDFDLLFYIYTKNFEMWDFYIVHYLLSYKNFRSLLDNLYSIPEKNNIFFYVTEPKHRKNIYTYDVLISFITKSEPKNVSSKIKIENKEIIQEKEKNEKQVTEEKKEKEIMEDNNNINYCNSIFIQKGLLIIASFINLEKKTCNEYKFHFNLDQLRKFQLMETYISRLSFFSRFLNINYEKGTITFDFESFNNFDESNWINDINKCNHYSSQMIFHYDKNKIDPNNSDEQLTLKEFPGAIKGTKIKIEMKCPLILIKTLDQHGYLTTEKVNVNYKVEKILSKIIKHNSIDLTKQIVNILKDNNFCRKIYVLNKKIYKKQAIRKRFYNKINN